VIQVFKNQERKNSLMKSFENFLASHYDYTCLLKKIQYRMWDISFKLKGKLSRHILIIGFNNGLSHLVRAIRKKTDVPIAIFCDKDINPEVYKLNNLHLNIFHFWGDPFDRSHLDAALLPEAQSVLVLSDKNEEVFCIEDGFALQMVRIIDQFYKNIDVVVEIQEPSLLYFLGYTPPGEELSVDQYYYWPFFMSGKAFMSSLFDAMVSWTLDQHNHLETLRKLVGPKYFKDRQSHEVVEHSNLMEIEVPEFYINRRKEYGVLF